METFWQDLKYGARLLRRSPTFTAVAILTLALGIGASTAIFSVVHGVLLQPLSYHDPDSLVLINHNYPKLDLRASVSAPGYAHYRDHARSFENVAALSFWNVNLTGRGDPERLLGMQVSANFFDTVGVGAAHGRLFYASEDSPGNHRVVVLNDAFWRRRYAADPNIIGESITLNGEHFTVLGVMPPGFQFGREMNFLVDLWVPIAFTPQQLDTRNLTNEYLVVLARLNSGVSVAQAQAEMNTIAAHLREQYMPGTDDSYWGLRVQPLAERIVGDIRLALWVLLGAVGFVLLIACANVANLLLSRATVRQREMAVRGALGAGRMRVVRQLLTESLLLALAGGAGGCLLAYGGVRLLLSFPEIRIPRVDEIGVDGTVLAFALGVSMLTGILFGLVPALRVSRSDLHDTLKKGGRGVPTASHRGLRSLLVVTEMALAIVLLTGAGLLMRSFWRLQQVDPGFRPENVLALQVALPSFKYTESEQVERFYRQTLEQLRNLPGVESSGATSILPMGGSNSSGSFRIEGRIVPDGEQSPHGDRWAVSPDYFRSMRVPLIRGRFFSERDTADAPGVAIIDETMARKYWPDEDPLGRRITFEGSRENPVWREVVGIVGHVKHGGLEGDSRVQYYLPHAQRAIRSMFLVLRTSAAPAGLAGPARELLRSLDPELPVYGVATLEEIVARSMAPRRFALVLLGVFAAVALVLAAVGIYGVMTYSVAQRTHEVGVRMALGAQPGDVLRLMVGQGALLVAAGLSAGLLAALGLTRLMSRLLFEVSASDPLTYAAIAAGLGAVALASCLLPARRATRVDPMVVLRYE